MSAFLVGGKLITDRNSIRNMWADHFEFLGKHSSNANFDSNFLPRVASTVRELFVSSPMTPVAPKVRVLSTRKLRMSVPN